MAIGLLSIPAINLIDLGIFQFQINQQTGPQTPNNRANLDMHLLGGVVDDLDTVERLLIAGFTFFIDASGYILRQQIFAA
ncbi:hypothetical protein [Amphritea sp. HPY]|uniref:hypothetical protein n=1 Tax=Amphritea sp. HPY TaxID=3421652 RepID=UPI003D7DC64C